MRDILIYLCFALINLCSSFPMKTNNEIISVQSADLVSLASFNICATQSINIDTLITENDTDDIIQFLSSWQRQVDSTSLNVIQIVFTIPYSISNESILNQTVFITDIIHNELLASLTSICMNASSFLIDYSTTKSLPHNVCLYLLLNLSSSTILREIMFCRTIDDLNRNKSSSDNSTTETSHAVGPSGFFILSQCIIILVMMFIIYCVQTARQKSLASRVSQRVFRSRPYITIFGNKPATRTSSNITIKPATALQAGLNQLALHRHFVSITAPTPIEEQVLAANDLTSTITDRRATRPCISRDLIDVKEFTKRMSVSDENSIDAELHAL